MKWWIKQHWEAYVRFPWKMFYKAVKYVVLMLKGDIPYELKGGQKHVG